MKKPEAFEEFKRVFPDWVGHMNLENEIIARHQNLDFANWLEEHHSNATSYRRYVSLEVDIKGLFYKLIDGHNVHVRQQNG